MKILGRPNAAFQPRECADDLSSYPLSMHNHTDVKTGRWCGPEAARCAAIIQ
jgi:hypothetical protein